MTREFFAGMSLWVVIRQYQRVSEMARKEGARSENQGD